MKFGVREIANVVFRAKHDQQIGSTTFKQGQPVFYLDSAKTSSMEGGATTVYATGGRGNARLIAWDGEKTLTFTMEDALISPTGFMILAGAGVIKEAGTGTGETLFVHQTETTDAVDATNKYVYISKKPSDNSKAGVYVFILGEDGTISTEPYIPDEINTTPETSGDYAGKYKIELKSTDDVELFTEGCRVLVDYYVEKTSGAQQIDITPESLGGNFYIEASTLFRDKATGSDWPAEFIIPNGKVQSNFTFTMASSGDPSTFTFTVDAFPDYTKFDATKKVLAALQIIEPEIESAATERDRTASMAEATSKTIAANQTDSAYTSYTPTTGSPVGDGVYLVDDNGLYWKISPNWIAKNGETYAKLAGNG